MPITHDAGYTLDADTTVDYSIYPSRITGRTIATLIFTDPVTLTKLRVSGLGEDTLAAIAERVETLRAELHRAEFAQAFGEDRRTA